MNTLIVHTEGFGNIIQIAPLMRCLNKRGIKSDLLVYGDNAPAAQVFNSWQFSGRIEDYGRMYQTPWSLATKKVNGTSEIPDSWISPKWDRSEVDTYLDLARQLGLDVTDEDCQCEGSIIVPPDAQAYDVVFCAGYAKGWEAKNYPCYDIISAELAGQGVSCASIGLPHQSVMYTHNETGNSIMDAMSVMRSAKMVIANDTGFYHLAAAMGCRTIAVFMGTSITKNYDSRFHRTCEVHEKPSPLYIASRALEILNESK